METIISPATQSPNSDIQLNQVDIFSSGSDVGNFVPCQVLSDDQASPLTHTYNLSSSPESNQSISTPNPFPDLRNDIDDLLSVLEKDAVPIPENQLDKTMGTLFSEFCCIIMIDQGMVEVHKL